MALIEIRGLTKLYPMGTSIVRALDGVDLTIERGEFVAITGASGSGKSTMMHLIGCLDRPTSGTYILNGNNVSDMSDRRLAMIRNREIGFVFQTFNLINRTSAAENVGVPLFYARQSNTRGPALQALKRVGLEKRSHHKPSELSGGERQRVAIARAIVNDPPLVLADEPTGNLDTRTGEQIMEIFHELNRQGVTIILVTHEHDVALQARRIVQMRDGKILWDRPRAQVTAADFMVRAKDPAPSDAHLAFLPGDDDSGHGGGGSAATAVLARPSRQFAAAATESARPTTSAPITMRIAPRPGAATSITSGIFSVGFTLVASVTNWLIMRGIDMSKFDPLRPPAAVMRWQPLSYAFAILGFIAFISAIVGLVQGIRALRHRDAIDRPLESRRRAIIGIVLCGGYLAYMLIATVFLMTKFASMVKAAGAAAK